MGVVDFVKNNKFTVIAGVAVVCIGAVILTRDDRKTKTTGGKSPQNPNKIPKELDAKKDAVVAADVDQILVDMYTKFKKFKGDFVMQCVERNVFTRGKMFKAGEDYKVLLELFPFTEQHDEEVYEAAEEGVQFSATMKSLRSETLETFGGMYKGKDIYHWCKKQGEGVPMGIDEVVDTYIPTLSSSNQYFLKGQISNTGMLHFFVTAMVAGIHKTTDQANKWTKNTAIENEPLAEHVHCYQWTGDNVLPDLEGLLHIAVKKSDSTLQQVMLNTAQGTVLLEFTETEVVECGNELNESLLGDADKLLALKSTQTQ